MLLDSDAVKDSFPPYLSVRRSARHDCFGDVPDIGFQDVFPANGVVLTVLLPLIPSCWVQ